MAALAWEAMSAPRAHLTFRDGACVIAVFGSTLGGSGKTPLAVACARVLAAEGHRVALVGHAYRARPRARRVVTGTDDVDVVGDEALACARELSSAGVAVVVGTARQDALDHALEVADVAIIDGAGQLSPRPAHLALLAVDGTRPWGAGACPPRGDLRVSKAALISACDRVVTIGEGDRDALGVHVPVDVALVAVRGAYTSHATLDWGALRARRVGLWTAIARPDRVVHALSRNGVTPAFVATHADHAVVSPRALARIVRGASVAGVDLWLATSKCVTRLPPALGGVPVATLDHALSLGPALVEALRDAVSRGCGPLATS